MLGSALKPLTVPGDKSISHRALLFAALAEGTSRIEGLSTGADVQSTRRCLETLGVKIKDVPGAVLVHGRGKFGLLPPSEPLDCGNSGTTMRLLLGILAGQSFESKLIGDESLSRRPMSRVTDPLLLAGARFELTDNSHAPIRVLPVSTLQGLRHSLRVQSAQVKSALLLSGLYAAGETWVEGDEGTRDHTERLLPYFGVKLLRKENAVGISGSTTLLPFDFRIPGDPSSAAFWAVAAALSPSRRIVIENALLNPTRLGFLNALKRAGAEVEIEIESEIPEPVGRLKVCGTRNLKPIEIQESEIPSLIDEIPVLAVALAARAEGLSVIRGAGELRVKESDRLALIAKNLRQMGAVVRELPDGLEIEGGRPLHGAPVETGGDHRIAMAFAIAGLIADGETRLDHPECVGVSYPSFFETLRHFTESEDRG